MTISSGRELQIPESQVKALGLVANYSDEQRKKLIESIAEAQPTLLISEFASQVSATSGLPVSETRPVLAMLASIYTAWKSSEVELGEFASDVIAAMQRSSEPALVPNDGDWAACQRFFVSVLALSSTLGVTARALGIMLEQPRIFSRSRIMTDLRPVFDGDDSSAPVAAVITHTLKIEHLAGEREEEFHVALDTKDLKSLQQSLERALSKELAIRKALEDQFVVLGEE